MAGLSTPLYQRRNDSGIGTIGTTGTTSVLASRNGQPAAVSCPLEEMSDTLRFT